MKLRLQLAVAVVAAGALAAVLLGSTSAAGTGVHAAAPRVLRVGTYNGIPGQYSSIQSAVDAAHPGDWILVGPGDYKEQADHRANRGPQPDDTPAGVVISTPNLHLRGMDRNGVVVDGTKPGSPRCSSSGAAQDFGPTGSDGTPLGRNGILVWKADNTWVENLTACNFRNGPGRAGNQIWWNGGDGSGAVGLHGFWGNYLNATSNYYDSESTASGYGIFASNSSGGSFDYTYASNMNDSNYYVGGCQQICNTTINHAWSEFSSLGYSGTNAGGTLVVENSQFDNNQDGFDTNSQNNDDRPSPQDGACPPGASSPITHTYSCWVFINNYVHDNNNPNVPGAGVASNGPVGTGVSISGARDNTVMNNRFENNGAWGVILVPYPDTETPPPGQNCQGGINSGPPTNVCTFDDWGNAIAGNTFKNNGFFHNDTNGDIAELTATAAPTNCFHDNTDTSGTVTTSPSGLQQSKPTCDRHTVPPDPNPSFTNQVACDSQFFAGALGASSAPCTPGPGYPRRTAVIMHPLPSASQLPSMPDPCAGVPANPWCQGNGLPSAHNCVSGSGFNFQLHENHHGRVVRVAVFVNGHRLVVRRGHSIGRITIRPPRGNFVVKIVALHADGTRVITTRTYSGCHKTKPKTKVPHHDVD